MSKSDQRNRKKTKAQKGRARAKKVLVTPSGVKPTDSHANKHSRPQQQNTRQEQVALTDIERDWRQVISITLPVLIGLGGTGIGIFWSTYPNLTIWVTFVTLSITLFLTAFVFRNFIFKEDKQVRRVARMALLSELILLVACLSWQYFTYVAPVTSLDTASGMLLAASDPNPPMPTSCPKTLPLDALRLYYGDSLAWTQTGDRLNVLQVAGNDLLFLERDQRGLYITAKILSSDGRYVVDVERNMFRRNLNNSWYQVRPDGSTLIVYDERKQEVLYVRYLNKNSVTIRGIFNYPGMAPIEIREGMQISQDFFSDSCVKVNKTGAVIRVG